jgi:hypothetical protein
MIQIILAIVLGIFGIYIIIMNWCILWMYIVKKKSSSIGGFLGGLLLCIAIMIIPNNPYPWLGLFAFIIDLGSLPSLICVIIFLVIQKFKK